VRPVNDPTAQAAPAPAAPAPTAAQPAPGKAPFSWRNFFALDLLDNRHPALHGLRFFAVISVLQYHISAVYVHEAGIFIDPWFTKLSTTVFFGMDLFFFLSGFLIGAILLRSIEVSKTQNVGRFYLRRIFRTFPSYYLVLTFLACIEHMTPMQKSNLVWEYLYGTNFTSLRVTDVLMVWAWSLALEEQFYLTVPLFVFGLSRLRSDRSRAIMLLTIWLSALVIRFIVYYRHRPMTDVDLWYLVYFRTKTRFDPLVAGIFMAFLQHRYKDRITEWLSRPRNRAIVALPTLACFWFLMDPLIFGDDTWQVAHLFLWGTVTSMFYMGLLLLLLHGHGWFQDFFSAPIFRKVATLGYGVYLVHVPILYNGVIPVARRLYWARTPMIIIWPASLAALVLLSLAAGYVLHIFVEKPSLRLRDRLAG
jgi:peptidoglycan/LPS O-acetylase OafA/YrhL